MIELNFKKLEIMRVFKEGDRQSYKGFVQYAGLRILYLQAFTQLLARAREAQPRHIQFVLRSSRTPDQTEGSGRRSDVDRCGINVRQAVVFVVSFGRHL
jgi:hypothetical protein